MALSAHANARKWYEMKKKQESKQEKTITAHEKAFKAAEKKTRHQLAQVSSFFCSILKLACTHISCELTLVYFILTGENGGDDLSHEEGALVREVQLVHKQRELPCD